MECQLTKELHFVTSVQVVLEQQLQVLPEVMVSSALMFSGRVVVGAVGRIEGKEEKVQLVMPAIAQRKIVLEVYPNPVVAGTSINIPCKEMTEGYYSYELMNVSGQAVRQGNIYIDKGAGVLNIGIPMVAGGNYFIRLTQRDTGKKYSEQICIR